jgi:aminopeptidase I
MTRYGRFQEPASLYFRNSDAQTPSRSEIVVDSYTQPFLHFISYNPTVFHTVAFFAQQLQVRHGFTKLSERQAWTGKLIKGGKYFFERNGSSLVAFVVGKNYQPGNGAAIIASHVDAITARLKPISSLPTKAGYVQLGVAPYAGGLNDTWWDRDLGIGGRVLVKDHKTGKIEPRLVKLGWPIARIPTLAPHFGAASRISNANPETRLVPIVGLDGSDAERREADLNWKPSLPQGAGTFTSVQPPRLVQEIAAELGIEDCGYLRSLLFGYES